MKLVQSYFPEINQASIKKLVEFQELLLDWNQKVNVISRKDEENFEERHVLHSLAIQQIVNFRKNSSVVDIGTGGGFPGLPLAIVNPTVNFTLVDSIGKKIALVKDIAHELGLKNVTAVNARAEDLVDTFDYAVSRAVAPAKKLLSWIDGLMLTDKEGLVSGGIYFLKGGDLGDELREARLPVRVYDIADFYDDPFFETKQIVHYRRTR